MRSSQFLASIAAGRLLTPAPAMAKGLPTKVGQCVQTKIKEVTSRLEGVPDSGSAIVYANGGYQVSYDMAPEVANWHPGDPVRFCLVELPSDCPPGDERGKIYSATNLRTKQSWEAPDAEHMCGGP